MNILNKIKIGGFVYNVERPSNAFVSEGRALDGEHDFAQKTITVAATGCGDYQDLVFIHEICHAIIEHYVSTKQSEQFVEQFSKGLYQVLVDNPELIKGYTAEGDCE